MQMSQSEWIAVAVLAAFVLFLALKGKLGRYWSLLLGGTTGGSSPTSTASPTATAGSPPASGGSSPTPAGSTTGSLGGAVAGPAVPQAITGTVTGDGQSVTQGWSLLPGILPALPPLQL